MKISNVFYEYKPLPYQVDVCLELLKYINNPQKHLKSFFMMLWSRRHGKDLTSLFFASLYLHMYPNSSCFYIVHKKSIGIEILQTKIANSNLTYLNLFPKAKFSKHCGTIILPNNSRLTLVTDRHENSVTHLVGMSCDLFICTELSRYASPRSVYNAILPAVIQKNALLIVCSTPLASTNSFYKELYDTAMNSDRWYVSKVSNKESNLYSKEELEFFKTSLTTAEYKSDIEVEFLDHMSDDSLVYAPYIELLKEEIHCDVFKFFEMLGLRNELEINVSVDLGYSDTFVVLFSVNIDRNIYIIETFCSNNKPVVYYCTVIEKYINDLSNKLNKVCKLNYLFLPHDSINRSLQTSISVKQQMNEFFNSSSLSCHTVSLERTTSISSDISFVQTRLRNVKIVNTKNNNELLKNLNNYRRKITKYDKDKLVNLYKGFLHDRTSHFADCFRYMILGYRKYIGI
jgi:hypothetical protein